MGATKRLNFPVFLKTARLRLRRFTADDIDLLVELDSDPEVMHFISGGRATSRAEIEAEVMPAFLGYYQRFPSYGFWAAHESATGGFVGWFHLRPAPESADDEPELGYRLRRASWGLGYATEGSQALIDLAFDQCGARRVVASRMAVNLASRRVMEKCGMTLIRALRQDWPDAIPGAELGDVEYAIDFSGWQQPSDLGSS